MKLYVLERTQEIPYPKSEVFAFFGDASNLARVTPGFLSFRILTPPPVAMRAGTIIDYQIGLFGVAMKWRTEITRYDPPHAFADVQTKGPYAIWRHTHSFEDAPNGTRMMDHVEYALPFGIFGAAAHEMFVRRTLQRIFDHRREAINRIFPQKS